MYLMDVLWPTIKKEEVNTVNIVGVSASHRNKIFSLQYTV